MGTERAITFECKCEPLLGILHEVDEHSASLGVLILVGGPQYRVGSHRQFVLMARAFASAGFPTFRFDYRGMGDSVAEPRPFDAVDDDIRAAIDAFIAMRPGLQRIVVFGLCDAASAAMIYAPSDSRVSGLILANPWVRSESGQAKAFMRHYYRKRVFQVAFWRKVLTGGFDYRASVADFLRKLRNFRSVPAIAPSFVDRMCNGVTCFSNPVLFLLSERDLTASEFKDLCVTDPAWSAVMSRIGVTMRHLRDADHTFSSSVTAKRVNEGMMSWLKTLG